MTKSKSIGVILFLLLASNSYAVRNGNSVNQPDNVVTLQIHKAFACTGLRISQNYIVTAAHCMTSVAPQGTRRSNKGKVKITYYDNGKKQTYNTKTSKAKIKSYKHSKELAVLYISSSNSNFQAPKISHSSADVYANNKLFYGYGYNEKGSLKKLRSGYLNFSETYSSAGHTMLVMKPGNSNQHPCPGDSGGPLFTAEGKAIGIVSFINNSSRSIGSLSAVKQCKAGNRSYFIYLSEHMDFLKPYLDATNLP